MKPKYFLFFFLTFLIFNCSLLIATVRYVSKTGSSTAPYTSWETAADSIQKCINICVDDDTIYVANGVYKENLVINTQIFLSGLSMDSTVIDGTGLGSYTIDINSKTHIENFRIFGKGTIESWAIRSYQVLNIKFCKISDCGLAVGMLGVPCIMNNVIVKNVTSYGFAGGCFSDTCGYFVSNSIFVLNSANAIALNTTIGGIYHINNNIMLFTGSSSSESGISIDAPKSVHINNNLISGFNNSINLQIHIDSASIKNNILINSKTDYSIWSMNDDPTIRNNIIKSNSKGIYGWNIDSDYNLFWQNDVDRVGIPGDSDIVADPMFVNDTIPTPDGNYDFHLQAYSPAIDRGDPNILDVDGTRSDIGMFGGPFGETYTYQDLAPLAPRNLSVVVDTNNITVRWRKNTEADTSFYNVYRDTLVNFTIDSTKLVSASSDSFFVQPNPHINTRYVYKVTCVDNQGNESRPSTELVVDIVSSSTNDYPMIISDYVLYQNYPNPFNPSTKIGYQLKERAYVKLMVYDIKGELVSVLVNKEQNAGYYEVEFNADVRGEKQEARNNIASGIYLYRIEVIGEGKIPVYTEMKKMLLIK